MKKAVTLTPEQVKDIIDSRPIKNALGVMSDKYGIGTGRVRSIWTQAYGGADLKSYTAHIKKSQSDRPVEKQVEKQVEKPVEKELRTAEVGGSVLKARAPKVVAGRSKPTRVHRQKIEQTEMDVAQIEAGNNSGDLIDAVKSAAGLAKGSQKMTKAALRQAEMANQLAHRALDMRHQEDIEYSISDVEDDAISDSCSVDPGRTRRGTKRVQGPSQDYQHANQYIQKSQPTPIHNVGGSSGYFVCGEEDSSSSGEEEPRVSGGARSRPSNRGRGKTRAVPTYRSEPNDSHSEKSSINRAPAGRRKQVSTARHQPEDQEDVYEIDQSGSEQDIGGRGVSSGHSRGPRGGVSPPAQTTQLWSRNQFKRPL